MPPTKSIIPFADYCRIFRVIYSVLDGRAHTHRACIFFAVAGAIFLRQHYKVKALPVAGAAAYLVDDKTSLVATFGKIEDDIFLQKQLEHTNILLEDAGKAPKEVIVVWMKAASPTFSIECVSAKTRLLLKIMPPRSSKSKSTYCSTWAVGRT